MRTIIGVVSILVAVAALTAVIAIRSGPKSREEPPWTTALIEGKYIPLADQGSPIGIPTSIPPESAIRLLVPPPPADLPIPPTPVVP